METKARPAALLVANWKSDVGYAWWLMESYWEIISSTYQHSYDFYLAYPEVATLPDNIQSSPIQPIEHDFGKRSPAAICKTLAFLKSHKIRWIYFSDKPSIDWVYLLYRLVGVHTIIIHDHAPGVRDLPGLFKRVLKRTLSVSFFAADALIAVSGFINKRHVEINCFPNNKCHIANNGIRLWKEVEDLDLHDKFGIPSNRKIMVMTGRANKYKGVEFVLECMQKTIKQHEREDLHFIFCGDGPDLEHFRLKATEFGISAFVTLPGRCEDIPAILNQCDFAIHASRGEVGYSLSILEYMYSTLPVIVSSNPSVCGATENNITGLIYPEGEVNAATEHILYLLDNPDAIDEMGTNAQKSVIRNYNLETSHKQLLDCMSNILLKRKIC